MKHLLLFSVILFFTSCTPWKEVSTNPSYTEIIQADGMTRDDIFVGINKWMAYEFASSESVINYADKEAGTISGRFISEYESKGYVCDGKSDIVFEVKDGRFKISFEARETRSKGLKTLRMLGETDIQPWTSIRWQHDLDAIMSQYDVVINRLMDFLNLADDNW